MTLWTDLAARADVKLSAEQIDLLNRYLDLLIETNSRMNLTRIVDRPSAEVRHVGDSLTVLRLLPRQSHRLVDVGSGGGVPGLPLAIARPDVAVTLVEATKKKAAFLQETAAALGLNNVTVRSDRAEDVGHDPACRQRFDVAVCRAVGTLDWLAEWCLPLVKVGGKMLSMKGPKVADELPQAAAGIKILGGGQAIIHPVVLPGTEHQLIVEIAKSRPTDTRFPRPATVAKGNPFRPA